MADMGERPACMTLDRRELDKPYELGNCRWATTKEQNRNRSDTHWITLDGERKSLGEWCEIKSIRYSLAMKRISEMGWSPEEALGLPSLGIGGRR